MGEFCVLVTGNEPQLSALRRRDLNAFSALLCIELKHCQVNVYVKWGHFELYWFVGTEVTQHEGDCSPWNLLNSELSRMKPEEDPKRA